MREPGGWSNPSGVPETSRMKTGTSTTVVGAPEVLPTVITSWAMGAIPASADAAGSSAIRKSSVTRALFTCLLHVLSRRLRRTPDVVDARAGNAQRPLGDRGLARAALVAQKRQRGIDIDAHRARRVELDLGDHAGEAIAVQQVRQRVLRRAADLERRLDGGGAVNRRRARRRSLEDEAERQRLR